jgi:hypothetical protein
MSDIDVLIPEPDMERAVLLLALHGYRSAIPDVERAFFALGGQLPLIGPRGRAAIDLHWRLSPRHLPGPDPDDLRERLVSLEVAGQEVPAFCPEDMLLYLCAHSGIHTWESLSMVCDLARVIDLFRLDWDAVWSRASQRHMLRAVSLGICLAKGLLRAGVPDVVWDRATVEATPMYNSVRKRLEDNTEVNLLKFWFQMLETPADRLRLARSIFEPNSTDWESLHIPWAFRHVYYFTRPFRLAWKWGFRRRA